MRQSPGQPKAGNRGLQSWEQGPPVPRFWICGLWPPNTMPGSAPGLQEPLQEQTCLGLLQLVQILAEGSKWKRVTALIALIWSCQFGSCLDP